MKCWQFHCESDWKKADIDEAREESESDVKGKRKREKIAKILIIAK